MPETDPATLWRFELRRGRSDSPQNGACLLDAVSWFAYGTLGDHPACVCDVIAAYARRINDDLPAVERQRLRAYIPRLVGTVDPDSRILRVEAIARHAICTMLPLMYEAVGFSEIAATLRALPADASMVRLRSAAIRALCVVHTEAAAAAAFAADAAGDDAYAGFVGYAVRAGLSARAALYAANAAYESDSAAVCAADIGFDAACAAASADAAKSPIYDAMIAGLDVMLAIGRQAEPVPVERFRASVEQFALAREAAR